MRVAKGKNDGVRLGRGGEEGRNPRTKARLKAATYTEKPIHASAIAARVGRVVSVSSTEGGGGGGAGGAGGGGAPRPG